MRTFLHDLATPLTIIRTLVKKQMAEVEKAPLPDGDKSLERMKKILDAVHSMERLHADQKAKISVLSQD